MPDIVRGTKKDFEDIVDFANYIFSQSDRPHDFKTLFPKLYGDGADSSGCHYLLKEGRKIKAMVCVAPAEMKIAGTILKTAGVGTVSVHPYSRGKGYMKELMKAAVKDMSADGTAFAFLGGQRQRYEYFGFEPSGVEIEFNVTKANLRHYFSESIERSVRLIPFSEGRTQWFDEAYELFDRQRTAIVRGRDDFFKILRSRDSELFAILDEGDFAGYVSMQANGYVTEILLKDQSLFPFVLRPLDNTGKYETIIFQVAPYELDKIRFLSSIAESWYLKANKNFMIFDWGKTMLALLRLKSGYEQLADGALNICIGEKTLQIAMSNGEPFVEETYHQPDIKFTSLQAAAFMFSALGELNISAYAAGLDSRKKLCLKTWFPLPLFIPIADWC